MAMHENNKKVKKKKRELHHREADCMFRSLTAGQNNYTCINTHTHHACAARRSQKRFILSDNVFSSAMASLHFAPVAGKL